MRVTSIGATIALITMAALCSASGAESISVSPDASAAQITSGKALTQKLRCTGCHAATLVGIPGFSPSITPSGVLKQYNQKTFETVLDTGVTPSGAPVSPPMKVYHLPASQADDIYFYLQTLK